jgi:hypothetical protein
MPKRRQRELVSTLGVESKERGPDHPRVQTHSHAV